MDIFEAIADLLAMPVQQIDERYVRYYSRLDDILDGWLGFILQACQVCYYLSYCNYYAVCLQAILFTIGCYRLSNDRNGAYALLGLQLTCILFRKHIKFFIGPFVLITVLTMVLKPFYAFIYMLRIKAYFDVLFTPMRYFNIINAILPEYITDWAFLAFYTKSELQDMYRYRYNLRLDDLLEVCLLVAFTYIFYMREFTEENVCLTAVGTVLWIFLRSRHVLRINDPLIA